MANTRKILQKSILFFAIGVLVIQFFRPTKNINNLNTQKDISKVVEVPKNIKHILKIACYDCHSNHTEYPWYAEIMPIGYLLKFHINEGKEHVNFSEFGKYSEKQQNKKLEDIEEEITDHEMPLAPYTFIHKEAKLTEEQIQQLLNWTKDAKETINYTL